MFKAFKTAFKPSHQRSLNLSYVESKLSEFKHQSSITLGKPKKVVLPLQATKEQQKSQIYWHKKIGEKVKTGEVIASFSHTNALPIVSSVTGVLKGVEKITPLKLSSFKTQEHAVITEIEEDEWSLTHHFDNWKTMSLKEVREVIKSAGIAGMGGAGFASFRKLYQNTVKHIVINAVECDPLISADLCLMQESGQEVIAGFEVLMHFFKPKSIHLAIKDKNQPFLQTLIERFENYNQINTPPIQMNWVVNRYPAGGEKQLIENIFSTQVKVQQPTIEQGYLSLNIATLVAMKRALVDKKASVSRIVTLFDEQSLSVKNYLSRLGTPLCDWLELTGNPTNTNKNTLLIGGPMMGFEALDTKSGIEHTTNCIQVLKPSPPLLNHDPCIRCGKCSDYCPSQLLPQQLYWSLKNQHTQQASDDFALFDCIECGICDYVCPSDIPLVQYFRSGKMDIREQQERVQFSDHSKKRYDFRQQRLESEKQKRAERLKAKRKEMEQNKASNTDADENLQAKIATKKEAIEQALKRQENRHH